MAAFHHVQKPDACPIPGDCPLVAYSGEILTALERGQTRIEEMHMMLTKLESNTEHLCELPKISAAFTNLNDQLIDAATRTNRFFLYFMAFICAVGSFVIIVMTLQDTNKSVRLTPSEFRFGATENNEHK